MLLSSVNFVAKPKTGKPTKGKDEKKKIAKAEIIRESDVCEQCLKEIEEENTIFKFPTSSCGSNDSFKTSGYVSVGSIDSCHSTNGDRVTIATGDDLCLTVDQFYYTIGLRDESRSDSTCIFRKRVLESKTIPNGQVDTAVFVLDCDQEFYLSTAKDKSLELNYYSMKPSLDHPDDRFFQIYHTSVGQTLIQPYLHKNYYLHHIDASLSVQQLDLNWRCPEEYFFHFNAVPEPIRIKSKPSKRVCTHKQSDCDTPVETTDSKCNPKDTKSEVLIPNRYNIELPKRKSSKRGLFSDLFVSCFSSRSRALAQNEV